MSSFRIRDLIVTIQPAHGGGNPAGLPADDGRPIPTPITPVASVIKATPHLRVAQAELARGRKADPAALKEVSERIGELVVAGIAVGQLGNVGLCTQDQPTQETCTPASRFAHLGHEIVQEDYFRLARILGAE